MAKIKRHQPLPRDWAEREKIRDKGQFWTPSWVAEAMVEYVANNSNLILDPATGSGAFLTALLNLGYSKITFYGLDIDEALLMTDSYKNPKVIIEKRDFIFNPPKKSFDSIVANPPYIRHHRLSPLVKKKLKELCISITGFTIDGRAGYHVYFLLQALSLLKKVGRLAFIMPADTFEGVFSEKLWNWITDHYRLDCVITFCETATPFPDVDTNAVIIFLTNESPLNYLHWVRVTEPHSDDLLTLVRSSFKINNYNSLDVQKRDLKESLTTGLSRSPNRINYKFILSNFAKVMRGIATGANSYFYLTKERVAELCIPDEFLHLAIGRTRDITDSIITKDTLRLMAENSRPTFLFSPDERSIENYPISVKNYLRYGEELGLNKRPLIKTRKPWYKMEHRKVPPILFAYLGRRNIRFIKNDAKVLPLTGFLCVYPNIDDKKFQERLWLLLNEPDTINNLKLVGKSYGAGAIKVEPRALEQLPIPDYLVEKYSLLDYARLSDEYKSP